MLILLYNCDAHIIHYMIAIFISHYIIVIIMPLYGCDVYVII